jgi:hypothetical protein
MVAQNPRYNPGMPSYFNIRKITAVIESSFLPLPLPFVSDCSTWIRVFALQMNEKPKKI